MSSILYIHKFNICRGKHLSNQEVGKDRFDLNRLEDKRIPEIIVDEDT